MTTDKKICPLRKPCQHCKKDYGRKLRSNGGGTPYLEAEYAWKQSMYCSELCRNLALAKQRKEKAGKLRELREGLNEHREFGYRMFCLGVNRPEDHRRAYTQAIQNISGPKLGRKAG